MVEAGTKENGELQISGSQVILPWGWWAVSISGFKLDAF